MPFIFDMYIRALFSSYLMLRRFKFTNLPFKPVIMGRSYSGAVNATFNRISRPLLQYPVKNYFPTQFRKFASTTGSPNYFLYNILSVNPFATEQEIKEAYIQQCKKFHPDTQHGNDKKFREIMKAYSLLKSESDRKEYDSFDKEQYGEFMKEWTKQFRSAQVEVDVDIEMKSMIRSQRYDKKSNSPPGSENTNSHSRSGEEIIGTLGAIYKFGVVSFFGIAFIWGCVAQDIDIIMHGILFCAVWPFWIIYHLFGYGRAFR